MRKTILMLLLALNGKAIADEWVEVNRNVYAAGYANPASIVRDGNIAKMWTLVDCKAMTHFIGGYPFMSIESHEEFDCRERRLRTLVYSLHPGKMGEGKEIFSDSNPSQWAPVLPDSEMADFLKIACSKK